MCGRAVQRPWSAMVGAEAWLADWLGPGNTNLRVVGGCWVVPGIAPSRYYPSRTPPGIPTLPHPPARTHHPVDGMLGTGVSGGPKEILGVEYARVSLGHRTPHLTQAPRHPWCRLWGLL